MASMSISDSHPATSPLPPVVRALKVLSPALQAEIFECIFSEIQAVHQPHFFTDGESFLAANPEDRHSCKRINIILRQKLGFSTYESNSFAESTQSSVCALVMRTLIAEEAITDEALSQALELIESMPNDDSKVSAFAYIVAKLRGAHIERALAIIEGMSTDDHKGRGIYALASELTEAQLEKAWGLIEGMTDHWGKSSALRGIVSKYRGAVDMNRVFTCIEGMTEGYWSEVIKAIMQARHTEVENDQKGMCLLRIVPRLIELGSYEEVFDLEKSLDASETNRWKGCLKEAIAKELSPPHTEVFLERAMRDRRLRTFVIEHFLEIHCELIEQVIRAHLENFEQDEVEELLPLLSPSQALELIEGMSTDDHKGSGIYAFASELTEAQLEKAWGLIEGMTHYWGKSLALRGIVSKYRGAVDMNRVFTCIEGMREGHGSKVIQAIMQARHTEVEMERVMAFIERSFNGWYRGSMLQAIAPTFTKEYIKRVVILVQNLTNQQIGMGLLWIVLRLIELGSYKEVFDLEKSLDAGEKDRSTVSLKEAIAKELSPPHVEIFLERAMRDRRLRTFVIEHFLEIHCELIERVLAAHLANFEQDEMEELLSLLSPERIAEVLFRIPPERQETLLRTPIAPYMQSEERPFREVLPQIHAYDLTKSRDHIERFLNRVPLKVLAVAVLNEETRPMMLDFLRVMSLPQLRMVVPLLSLPTLLTLCDTDEVSLLKLTLTAATLEQKTAYVRQGAIALPPLCQGWIESKKGLLGELESLKTSQQGQDLEARAFQRLEATNIACVFTIANLKSLREALRSHTVSPEIEQFISQNIQGVIDHYLPDMQKDIQQVRAVISQHSQFTEDKAVQIPDHFVCAVGAGLMKDPVRFPGEKEGVYDLESLVQAAAQITSYQAQRIGLIPGVHVQSPTTRAVVPVAALIHDTALAEEIRQAYPAGWWKRHFLE